MEHNKTPIENQGLRNWIKENEKTPIEQWIEEESERRYPIKRHQTPSMSPYVGSQKTFQHGINAILTYLGLDILDPKKWVEEMKGHKDITGFETPSELAAYEKGREHEEKVMVKFISDWTNETNSVIGQLLADKTKQLQSENNQYKKAIAEQAIDYQYISIQQAMLKG